MRNELFLKACYAGGPIAPHTIVKHGAADAHAVTAAAATDASFGISDSLGAKAAGDPLDVIRGGIALVKLGGTVVRGDALTANATGLAIKATVAGSRVIGFAENSGVAGDLGSVFIAPGFLATAGA